jgi:hypothetical protein
MRSLAWATDESGMQSKASHSVIALNNISSLCEQTEYMRDRAGRMSQHRTTAPHVAFSPKKAYICSDHAPVQDAEGETDGLRSVYPPP